MKKSYTLRQFLLNWYIIFSTLFQLFKWYSLLHTSISHLLVLRVTWCNSDITKQSSQILNSTLACVQAPGKYHSCPQGLHSFWSAPHITTSAYWEGSTPEVNRIPVTMPKFRVWLAENTKQILCACSENWTLPEVTILGAGQDTTPLGMRMGEDKRKNGEWETQEWTKQSGHAGQGSL